MNEEIMQLMATLEDRKANPREGSYTNFLLDKGEDAIVQKIGEEAVEVVIAVKGQGDERVIEETADLIYHLSIMLVSRGLTWDDIGAELASRRK